MSESEGKQTVRQLAEYSISSHAGAARVCNEEEAAEPQGKALYFPVIFILTLVGLLVVTERMRSQIQTANTDL